MPLVPKEIQEENNRVPKALFAWACKLPGKSLQESFDAHESVLLARGISRPTFYRLLQKQQE